MADGIDKRGGGEGPPANLDEASELFRPVWDDEGDAAPPAQAEAPKPAANTVGQSAQSAAAAHKTVGEAPAAANSVQGAAGSAGAEGVRVVVIKVKPASAIFYYKGKRVGTSPLRVELRPGEKRAFEVGHPGYNTRKVVVDGTEPEISVGLFPKSGGATTPP